MPIVYDILIYLDIGQFKRSSLKSTPWEMAGMNYSLLCLHTRFNKREMEDLMGEGTAYVTMLRDPVDMFESQYGYYKLERKFGVSLGNIVSTQPNMLFV